MARASHFLRGPRIEPKPLKKGTGVPQLVDEAFLAYNAGRLHDACQPLHEEDAQGGRDGGHEPHRAR